MKHYVIYLILILGTLSCSNNEETYTLTDDLIGKWLWIKSCGGVSGACEYPKENQIKTIEFFNGAIYIEQNNGVVTTQTNYFISEVKYYEESVSADLDLGDGYYFRLTLEANNLYMDLGEFIIEYQRID